MSHQHKKPAHEVVLSHLELLVNIINHGDLSQVEYREVFGCIIVLTSVLGDMVIPEAHQKEIVRSLYDLASRCCESNSSKRISRIADELP